MKKHAIPWFAAAAVFFFRCGILGPSENGETGSVSPNLIFVDSPASPGAAKSAKTNLTFPALVFSRADKVSGVLKHSKGTVTHEVPFSDKRMTFAEVPKGDAQLDVAVKDRFGVPLVTGSQKFAVAAGKTATPDLPVTLTPPPAPAPIIDQECQRRVRVFWPNGGGTATGYRLEKRLGTDANWQQIFQTQPNALDNGNIFEIRDTSVSPGNTYLYRVIAEWQVPTPVISPEASKMIDGSLLACNACPPGMTRFDTPATGSFCIDKVRDGNTAIGFIPASDACKGRGGQHLCSPSRWEEACKIQTGLDGGVMDLSGAVTEWVADNDNLISSTPVYLYNTQPGNCTARNLVPFFDYGSKPGRGFRCCK